MRKVMLALALGATALGGAALAQDGPRGGGRGMGLMRADTNGDGVVTRAEYQAQADERFARMDANGDGRLGEGEGPRGRMMNRPDAPPPSADGTPPPPPPADMTRDQFRQMAMARFDRLDANHDGKIDQAEMDAMRAMRRPGPPTPPADQPAK